MMKAGIYIVISIVLFSCGNAGPKKNSVELIAAGAMQDSLFKALVNTTNDQIPSAVSHDSLAFLVLPLQASCPGCRDKTIDSIVQHQKGLKEGHFIIVSAKGGRKFISSFFREQESEIPAMDGRLFLDSTNKAGKLELYKNNPVMYYAYKEKVYKKVAAIPATVKSDLREFFSGNRIDK